MKYMVQSTIASYLNPKSIAIYLTECSKVRTGIWDKSSEHKLYSEKRNMLENKT